MLSQDGDCRLVLKREPGISPGDHPLGQSPASPFGAKRGKGEVAVAGQARSAKAGSEGIEL
jgi:hypothetical protein